VTINLTDNDDLHVHDLRHEAISRVAEIGSNTRGGFSLIDLQHFSGHRDVCMLLRYAHLCTQSLAKRLDEAFSSSEKCDSHHGRRRLKKEAKITVEEMVGCEALVSPVKSIEKSSKAQSPMEAAAPPVYDVNSAVLNASRPPAGLSKTSFM